jgi:uncharacterized membrane protein
MNQHNETVRLESFSDGIFAIAMTLLVIQIKVPKHEVVALKGLAQSLAALWPSYLAFSTSFITILVIWIHHHWIFRLIKRDGHALFYWNGLLLFFVSFIPFPTALLSEYLLHPEAKVASSLYSGTFLATSLSLYALWRHASKNLLSTVATEEKKDEAVQLTNQYRYAPPLYLLIFMLSFVSESWSAALCLLLALFFALRGWPVKSMTAAVKSKVWNMTSLKTTLPFLPDIFRKN